MTYGPSPVSNTPLQNGLPVARDTVTINGQNSLMQIVKLDIGAEGLSNPVTSLNPLPASSPSYISYVDEASSTVTYVGEAVPGTATSAAAWRIKRVSVSGSITSILYAGSAATFVNVWNNRAALSYG